MLRQIPKLILERIPNGGSGLHVINLYKYLHLCELKQLVFLFRH